MKRRNWTLGIIAASAFALGAACGGGTTGDNNGGSNNGTTANNGKGDTPTGETDELCEARRTDLVNSTNPAFLPDFIRWPCGDVEGVNTENRDDRGQEYCEYFAIIQTPDELGETWTEKGLMLGRPHIADGNLTNCSSNSDCAETENCIAVGRESFCAPRTTSFNDDQQFFLEDRSDEAVGKCVFTSWHSDVTEPLPCGEACTPIYGHDLSIDNFKMLTSINSNGAASDLVQKCVSGVAQDRYKKGDPENPEDPFHDHFTRACMWTADLFGTHWRVSDPTVCTAAVRAAECGCTVGGDPDADLGFALVPSISQQQQAGGLSLRGFPLGTWSAPNALPNGCRYVETGAEVGSEKPSQTIVECDIFGSDLLTNLKDPKEFCRAKYGRDIVVHVPIPKDTLVCEPPADGQYTEDCGEFPWVIVADDRSGN